MRPVLPSDNVPVEEADVGFMDEIGWLPVARTVLAGQEPPRHLAKLSVHERRQQLECIGFAAAPGLQQSGQIGLLFQAGEL